ncbi:MAG: DUF1385 domain-containing protein [Oscillospiraceae bacterium]
MKEKFKTSIGGQAVLEGIVMKGPDNTCLAARLPNGEIHTEMYVTKKNPVAKIPIVRGAVAMVQSLAEGYKSLMRSADLSEPAKEENGSEEKKQDDSSVIEASETDKTPLKAEVLEKTVDGKKEKGKKAEAGGMGALGLISAVLGGFLAIAMFIVLPTVLTGLIANIAPIEGYMAVVEGIMKIVIFITYLYLVTRIKDIRRVYMYHGAEHKTINCYEHGEELVVENIRKFTRFHPRCGTSFLFVVILVSIILFSFVPWSSTILRALYKLLLLPLTMGISFEIIKYSGRHDNILSRVLSAPGLWVQRLTTFEPDDGQIEVAIAAVKAVLPKDSQSDRW